MRQVPVLIDTAKGGTSDGLGGGDWGWGGASLGSPSGLATSEPRRES